METLFASRIRTGSCVATDPRRSWSPNSKQFRTTTFAPNRSINRYYDPTTDSFISVDPDFQMTYQAYLFTNDNPLNATDPLGLKCKVKSCSTKITESGTLTSNGYKPIIISTYDTDNGMSLKIVSNQSSIKVVVVDNGLTSGLPYGTDGVSLCAQSNGACSGRSLIKTNDAVEFTVPSADASSYSLGNHVPGHNVPPSYTWILDLTFSGPAEEVGDQFNSVFVAPTSRQTVAYAY